MQSVIKSIHLSFKLDIERLADDDISTKVRRIPALCLDKEAEILEHGTLGKDGGMVLMAMAADGHVTLHVYMDGTIAVDIQRFLKKVTMSRLEELEISKSLELKIKQSLGEACLYSRCIPAQVQRGYVTPYFSTSDDLLQEYSMTLVFEKESKWQNIKIYNSEEFGHILALDDDIMIAESDLIYTHTLLGVGRNDFRNKSVLILGGGDGGILYEVLKERPKFVIMAELDEEVVKACRKFTRNICYDALDAFEGPNYKIQFGDCMKVLKASYDAGKVYDYVINDLSEFQLGQDSMFYQYDFKTSSVLLELSFGVLAEGGKYLSRGNGVKAKPFLDQYESDIRKLGMKFTRFNVDVPSFKERYCLYEVWKGESDIS